MFKSRQPCSDHIGGLKYDDIPGSASLYPSCVLALTEEVGDGDQCQAEPHNKTDEHVA